eukprot:744001_1
MDRSANSGESCANKPLSKLSNILKTKLKTKLKKKKQSKQNKNNDFIIKHKQMNENKDIVNTQPLDIRQKVFISLVGLYQTWESTPTHVLYTAIFILPLKKEWIHDPSKYVKELQSHSGSSEMETFAQMLQWKDKQGLAFWMLDHDPDDTNINTGIQTNELIHPFWYYLSDKLNAMKHNKLNLDVKWWQNNNLKTCAKTSSIMCELFFMTMKFKTIKDILYQSNPESLDPIAFYSSDSENVSYDDNNDGLWISSEYDPYDMDM